MSQKTKSCTSQHWGSDWCSTELSLYWLVGRARALPALQVLVSLAWQQPINRKNYIIKNFTNKIIAEKKGLVITVECAKDITLLTMPSSTGGNDKL